MKVAIIGAGNGGLAFGVKIIEAGHEVSIYDAFEEQLKPLQESENTVKTYEGNQEREYKFNVVSSDLRVVTEKAELIFVVTPAFTHRKIAHDLKYILQDNQIVVLHPGRTGGALEFYTIFKEYGSEAIIAEAETLLFAARRSQGNVVNIYGMKERVGIAAIPSKETESVVTKINKILPYFYPLKNILHSSLCNIGAIFHPTPFIFNISRIENQQQFLYYHEGITPTIAKILEYIDKERLYLGEVLNLKLESAREWVNRNYSVDGDTLYESIQKNKSYKDIYSPTSIQSRYTLEDIPMSLVPLSLLAKELKIKTPVMDSIIQLANKIYERDFFEEGRDLLQINKSLVGRLIAEFLEKDKTLN